MGLLTAEDVSSALTVCCGEEPDGPAEAVAMVRQSQPSLAATLYSAWQAEGAQLDPALHHDLAVARARNDYYREVAAELQRRVPALIPIKGLAVADLYPEGLTRAMNDLDYIAPAEPELWRAVGTLVEDGWDLHTATFAQFGGEKQIMVSLRRPHEQTYVLPYGVEIATYAALGDLWGVPPLHRLPEQWRAPVVKNTLMLLFERFEQSYRARDLVDAALLLGSANPDELATLRTALERLGLQPEYAELTRLVAGTTFGPLPLPPPAARNHPITRIRRVARGVGFLRRPVSGTARHLQRRQVNGRSRRYERVAWAAAQRSLPVPAALRAGLMAFGLPLDGAPPRVQTAVLHEQGEVAWIDTPVGRFLLTIGDDVPESALEQLSEHAGVPSPADGTLPGSAE